jgi:hypothetical protein
LIVGSRSCFEQLEELARREPEAYVGFDGGVAKLKSQPLEYLLGRTYRWDNDGERGGKNARNWLRVDEVVKLIMDRGIGERELTGT